MEFAGSGVEIAPWVPPLVAFGISIFTSMSGVSGAFILLPFQVSVLGYAAPSVSATNQLFNVVATPGGVYQFVREGRMLWPLAWSILCGSLPGVFIGAWIRVAFLPEPERFRAFAGAVLLLLALRLLVDLWSGQPAGSGPLQLSNVRRANFSLSFSFQGQEHTVPLAAVLGLSFGVGILGGAYGVGGGAIVAPFLVTVLKLPVHVVAGSAMLGTLGTSLAGVLFFEILAGAYPELEVRPDWTLGLLFGAGGFFGILIGSRMQRFVPAFLLKGILLVCTAAVAARYLG